MPEKRRVSSEFRVDRTKEVCEVLLHIKTNLEARCSDLNDITELIELWKGDYSAGSQKNEEAIRLYKNALQARIGVLCDAMNRADIENAYDIMNQLLRANIPDDPWSPENGYRGLNYHYGNVVKMCTSEKSNTAFLKRDLSYVMEGYAQKWVEIDVDSMSKDTILKLLTVAQFLESNHILQSAIS